MKCNRVQLTQTPKRNKNDLGKQGSELLGLKLNFNYPVMLRFMYKSCKYCIASL